MYFRTANALLYRNTSAFHALSPSEAEHIACRVGEERIYFVPQGAELADAKIFKAGRKAETELIFAGRLDVSTKGLDLLLDAFAEVERLDVVLTLIGPDWRGGRAWLEHRSAALGIGDRVRFTGSVTSSELAYRMRNAGLYIQLSRFEGSPLSVAQALLAGKPAIISTAIGTASYPEIASLPHVSIVPPDSFAAAQAITNAVARLPELTVIAEQTINFLRGFFAWDRIASLHLKRYGMLTPSTAKRAA
jgi:glycosyltransferase involved in cell wall biosynthesis